LRGHARPAVVAVARTRRAHPGVGGGASSARRHPPSADGRGHRRRPRAGARLGACGTGGGGAAGAGFRGGVADMRLFSGQRAWLVQRVSALLILLLLLVGGVLLLFGPALDHARWHALATGVHVAPLIVLLF